MLFSRSFQIAILKLWTYFPTLLSTLGGVSERCVHWMRSPSSTIVSKQKPRSTSSPSLRHCSSQADTRAEPGSTMASTSLLTRRLQLHSHRLFRYNDPLVASLNLKEGTLRTWAVTGLALGRLLWQCQYEEEKEVLKSELIERARK